MFNISLITSENNPYGARARTAVGVGFDTWTTPFTRLPAMLKATGGAVGGLPRRLWNHLFAASDTEASWHGWQVISERRGLSRRYRDPAFDSLAACARCQGTGRDRR